MFVLRSTYDRVVKALEEQATELAQLRDELAKTKVYARECHAKAQHYAEMTDQCRANHEQIVRGLGEQVKGLRAQLDALLTERTKVLEILSA